MKIQGLNSLEIDQFENFFKAINIQKIKKEEFNSLFFGKLQNLRLFDSNHDFSAEGIYSLFQ